MSSQSVPRELRPRSQPAPKPRQGESSSSSVSAAPGVEDVPLSSVASLSLRLDAKEAELRKAKKAKPQKGKQQEPQG